MLEGRRFYSTPAATTTAATAAADVMVDKRSLECAEELDRGIVTKRSGDDNRMEAVSPCKYFLCSFFIFISPSSPLAFLLQLLKPWVYVHIYTYTYILIIYLYIYIHSAREGAFQSILNKPFHPRASTHIKYYYCFPFRFFSLITARIYSLILLLFFFFGFWFGFWILLACMHAYLQNKTKHTPYVYIHIHTLAFPHLTYVMTKF